MKTDKDLLREGEEFSKAVDKLAAQPREVMFRLLKVISENEIELEPTLAFAVGRILNGQ